MKTANQSIILLWVLSFFLLACNKDDFQPLSLTDMWDCHYEKTWDTLKTENTLIGEWEWQYVRCFWTSGNDTEFEGMTIEFNADGTLDVKENGQIIQTSNWQVVEGDTESFAVDTEPIVDQLFGRILFCNERVVFNDSYIDGCDNFFKRK